MKLSITFAILSFVSMTACVTPVKDLKLLSMVADPKVSKSIGPISAQACVDRIFGIQLGRDPTLSDAIGKLTRESNASYIQSLAFDGSHSFNIFFYGRTCVGVKGVGYK